MNPYRVLGVSTSMSLEDIRTVYRNLAKKYHPDGAEGDAKKFMEVNKAWETIKSTHGTLQNKTKGILTHKTLFTFRRL